LLLGEWANLHAKISGGLRWRNVARYFYPSIILVALLVLILIGSIDRWIEIVFFSSKFSGSDIETLKRLLQIYFIGIPMLIGTFILTRVIIIFQQYKLFTAITFSGFIMNILLNLIFINSYGINGVAISTTLVDSLLLVALFTLSRKILR
jgi:putative peptidoglycan lipid II flippase